jgi:hypothetical protein
MRKAAVLIALVATLLPAIAYAQDNKGPPTARSDSEKKRDAEIDKAYRDAIRNTSDSGKGVKTDPWQTIRPANSSDNTKR